MELKDVDIDNLDLAVDKSIRTRFDEAKDDQIEELFDEPDEEETDAPQYYRDSDYAGARYEKPVKRGPLFTVLIVILFLLTATGLAFAILYAGKDMFLAREEQIEEEVTEDTPIYSQTQLDGMIAVAVEDAKVKQAEETSRKMEEELRAASEKESGVLYMLRDYYPDDMVFIYGSYYEYYPINRDLKQNTVDNKDLKKDELTGYITYEPDGTKKSHMCIDVSSFQKEIDWDKAKAAGVEYAMIRCGFRGYGSGKLVEDTYFTSNIEAATSAGIKVGVYFFTQATSEEEAIEEAEYALELIKPYEVDLPVAIDIEEIDDKARTDNLTNEDRTNFCVAFLDKVRDAGYTPMIYSNLKFFIKRLDMDKLEAYEKWYAFYNDQIYFPYEISMWQYTSNGTIDGIGSGVDLNITFKDY